MIAHVDNRITYNGNGNATEFAYQFKILDRTDIKVMLVKPDGSTQILSKDYYVDVEKSVVIYPGYAPGAEIPESERPPVLPAGWRLVLYREVPITQLVRLPEIWPFNVIEAMADKLTLICQQLKDKLSRALTINESSASNIDTTVPWVPGKTFRVSDDGTHLQATEDPGKVIDEAKGLAEETATNAQEAKQAAAEIKTIYNSGGLTPVADLAGSIGTAIKRWGYIFANKVFAMNLPIVYKSVAEMKADSLLSAGMTACTLGYYAPNDGGRATYIIRAKQEADVDDGGSLHELANGNVAELVVENGTVNVKQFGAKGDGVTDDSSFFAKAINAYAIVDLVNEKYCLLNTVNISKSIVLKNGSLYMPSSDKNKHVFWMPYVHDANPLTVKFEFIRFSSVRDKKTTSPFEDTELTSNIMFFQNSTTQPCKLIFKNCDIAQCEYCVKKDDSTNELFVVKNCYFHDSLMPLYSNGHFLDIRNSDIECIATNRLYHCVYMLLHNVNDVDIKAYNCNFITKNRQGGTSFQAYTDASVEYRKSEKIPIYLYSCILSDALGIGHGRAAIYEHCIGYFTACSLAISYNGVYNNCSIYIMDSIPKPYTVINNSVIHIDKYPLGINVTSETISIYNSFIDVEECDGYPLNISPSNKDLPKKNVTIINSYFDDATTHHLIRLNDANLTFLNNTITRQSPTTSMLIYATGDSTTTIAGNVVISNDSSYPTENNIVIPIQ